MLQNPYLTPPQVESALSRSWQAGFIYGFQGPEQSSQAQANVQTEDADAFGQGVLDGQNAAINGIELDQTCVDLNVERPSLPHVALDAGSEALFSAAGIAHAGIHLAGLAAEAAVAVVVLSITLQTTYDDPSEALSKGADGLQGQLQAMGFDAAMTLFIGAGIDIAVTGCELKATAIFRSQDAATSAVKAMGRSRWVVASWRTDQSGGATVVDSLLP